jgi:hypothetical protein
LCGHFRFMADRYKHILVLFDLEKEFFLHRRKSGLEGEV